MVFEIIYNEYLPIIRDIIQASSEYADTIEITQEIMSSLQENLTVEDSQKLIKLEKYITEAKCIENQAFFYFGLSLGLSVMKESSLMLEKRSKIAI